MGHQIWTFLSHNSLKCMPNMSAQWICIRWLLRFEFQLPHPILNPALATDKKWPWSQFHISYQNSEISWPKVLISDFQSQLSTSKIIRIFPKKIFIEKYHFRTTFLLLTFFHNLILEHTLLSKVMPNWQRFNTRHWYQIANVFYRRSLTKPNLS